MMYAWSKGEVDRENLSNRIRADLFQNEEGICPLHGCAVVSTLLNGIWQWTHKACSNSRRGRRSSLQRE